MENLTKISWLLLALIHFLPALVFFMPDMVEKLYGVSPQGEVGLLLIHRGGLFLAVLAVTILAIFMPDTRRLASVVTAISVISFLVVYIRMGLPAGSLRKIALMDAVALIPLVWVLWASWGQGKV